MNAYSSIKYQKIFRNSHPNNLSRDSGLKTSEICLEQRALNSLSFRNKRIPFTSEISGRIFALSECFRTKPVSLRAASKTVRSREIFIEEIFITFWNICHAHTYTLRGHQIWQATHGFDDAKCHSRDPIAPQRVEFACENEELQRAYHESLCIPQRWFLWRIQLRHICIISRCDKYTCTLQ